jgi:multidrug efflux system outer membrane protein
MSARLVSLGAVACLLAACSQPVKQLPDDLQGSWVDAEHGTTTADAAALTWWKAFDDATIDALVEMAQQRNLDLRVAEARVREVRAQRRATVANLAPQIDATIDGQRNSGRRSGFGSEAVIEDTATAGASASWEIDLFGRLRAESRAANAELGAAQADRDGVRLTLIAEVVRNCRPSWRRVTPRPRKRRYASRVLASIRASPAGSIWNAHSLRCERRARKFRNRENSPRLHDID